MDSRQRKFLQERTLFQEVGGLAGISEECLENELGHVLEKLELNPKEMSVDDLRKAMLLYLDQVFLEAQEDSVGKLH